MTVFHLMNGKELQAKKVNAVKDGFYIGVEILKLFLSTLSLERK